MFGPNWRMAVIEGFYCITLVRLLTWLKFGAKKMTTPLIF